MVFASRQRRAAIAALFIKFGVDAVIAVAMSYLITGEGENGLVSALIVFVIIQAVGIAIGLRNLISAIVYYTTIGQKLQIAAFKAALDEAKLPAPEPYEPSHDAYLSRLVGDEGLEVRARLGAAKLLGLVECQPATMGLIRSFFNAMAYEKALEEYRDGPGRAK